MERLMRPDRFDADPNAPDATKQWNHWFCTFSNFLDEVQTLQPRKLKMLYNYISPAIYDLISEYETYEDAIEALEALFVKPKNEIFARHLLATCKQESGQTLDQFAQKLKNLSKDCNFQAVTAEQYRNDALRDAFISGLQSTDIRQRLLEKSTLDFQGAFDTARSLELAQKQSQSYVTRDCVPCNAAPAVHESKQSDATGELAVVTTPSKCLFCGFDRHLRFRCPARNALCKSCGKKGHFQRVCLSTPSSKHNSSTANSVLSAVFVAAAPTSLSNAVVRISANGVRLNALVDTGSSDSYISSSIVHANNWKVTSGKTKILMASTSLSSYTEGQCFLTLGYRDALYPDFKLSVMPDLCADLLLGHDFLKLHEKVEIPFGGTKPSFSVCGLMTARIDPPFLFGNLSRDVKPIATRSRRHAPADEAFIRSELQQLLNEGIVEPSNSPWRAQVLVTSNERHKRRMVIDYSQTINRYTQLDAYPLPRIDQLVEKVASYSIFSTLDLKSAYHQIPLRDEEKPYTAFEACGRLYQFRRIPFGVTNGVACFQRVIDSIIAKEKLSCTFAYIDNVIICGKDKNEHDQNLANFLKTAEQYGLTFNESKSIFASESIKVLGYDVSKGIVKPDPQRLSPLREMPAPTDLKSQQRAVGMFSYYSPWISHFSDKIYPIIHNKAFPISGPALEAFENLKKDLENALLVTFDPSVPLVVETDASDNAIAATLNQNGRPVAFFSRTLTPSERHHSAVEKEACAIVEAVRKWRHFLAGNHFRLVTDQRSVAFMYDNNQRGKVKNDKIQRWRLELSSFHYDVVYRPGKENQAADAFSRSVCGATPSSTDLKHLHDSLCHPGITRLMHFVRARNLPFSLDEVKNITANCRVCSEVKPRFFRPLNVKLIKATQPFERLSVDFKGPLPSSSKNRYLLTMIDEYSRFPFAFPCQDVSAQTVINCFCQLFAIFGMPSFIHSDRGASFMSSDLRNFLHEKGIATSRTTPYNPEGNGQVERLNGTLWKAVLLALRTRSLSTDQWELVLSDALHSIRSLLCTATNATPHERLFSYNRRSTSGTTLPTWLSSPGPVLLKRSVRSSKFDPFVEEVELLECNPHFAYIRFPNGREETVSVRHLAPTSGRALEDSSSIQDSDPLTSSEAIPENLPSPGSPGFASPGPPGNRTSHPGLTELTEKQQRVHPYSLRSGET